MLLTPNDLVFVTNGSITESSTYGDNETPAPPTKVTGGSWNLWRNLAKQSPEFGHPEKFYQDLPEKVGLCQQLQRQIIRESLILSKAYARDPLAGKTVTGGIITVNDSAWQMSFTVNRQQQFKAQPKDEVSVWIYALYSNVKGIISTSRLWNVVVTKFARNGYIIWVCLPIKLRILLKTNVIAYQFICLIFAHILCQEL